MTFESNSRIQQDPQEFKYVLMCSDRRRVNEDVLEFEEGLRYNNFDKFEHISSEKRYVTES